MLEIDGCRLQSANVHVFLLLCTAKDCIIQHPADQIIAEGPPFGRSSRPAMIELFARSRLTFHHCTHRSLTVTLSVQTHMWPEATFQWIKDGVDIDGASSRTLTVDLTCKPDSRLTQFRCKNCRRIDRSVPANAYETICSYCSFVTTSPEIQVRFPPPMLMTSDDDSRTYDRECTAKRSGVLR
jgi:hypothetical protein